MLKIVSSFCPLRYLKLFRKDGKNITVVNSVNSVLQILDDPSGNSFIENPYPFISHSGPSMCFINSLLF